VIPTTSPPTPIRALDAVEAALLSPNPYALNVLEQAITQVVWQFRAGNDVIPLGEGRVDVSSEVDDGTPGPGTCSGDDAACTTNADRVRAPIEGFCISRDDYPDSQCGYPTRRDTGLTNTCEGETYGKCETAQNCPTGLACGSFGVNWCGVDAVGTCSTAFSATHTSDADCVLDRPSVCQICGDGITQQSGIDCPPGYDSQGEQCDDGNTVDGDGCSSDCTFKGVCADANGYPGYQGCATDADCGQACYVRCACQPVVVPRRDAP
jgi:cysteine-rich repeat protein